MTASATYTWIDIGTSSFSTLFRAVAKPGSAVMLIGVEPLLEAYAACDDYVERHKWRSAVKMVHAACSAGVANSVTFYQHEDPQCSSLLRDMPLAGRHALHHGKLPQNRSSGANFTRCIGGHERAILVPRLSLKEILLKYAPAAPARIELLKLDTQGSELACLLSAGEQIERIDNLFIEVQDVPEAELLYRSAHTFGQVSKAPPPPPPQPTPTTP